MSPPRPRPAAPAPDAPAQDVRPTVGVLSVGADRSGITVYDGHLAELLESAGHRVTRARARPTGRRVADVRAVAAAARSLAACDVVVTSYSRNQWSPDGAGRLGQAVALAVVARSRAVVVLHDVDDHHRWGRGTPYRRPHDESAVLSVLLTASRATVVHSDRDAARLSWRPRHGLTVLPHVITPRALPERAAARRRLVPGGGLVLCVLGFVHERKDPLLALEVLARLPRSTQLWYAGQVSTGSTISEEVIMAAAQRLGVADRVTVTGYLGEDELSERVAAADVGLCLFRDVSASGSLAMWLAAATPVVGRDIPGLREAGTLAPRAVAFPASDSPGDIAATVADVAGRDLGDADFRAVLADSSPAVVAARLSGVVRAVSAGRHAPREARA